MEKFNVFGISGDKQFKVEDLFEVQYDETDMFFAYSKETFTHDFEEDNLNFKYKYVIEADYCDGDIYYALYLVPMPDSLYKDKLESVLASFDIDAEDCSIYDVRSYGLGILFGSTKTDGENVNEDTIDAIANAMPTMDRLRGFYLDNIQNLIGNSGWDYLNEYINGIDATKVALDRYKTDK